MLAAGICLVLVAFGVWHCQWDRERPIDEDELRVLRRQSERIRSEEGIFD